MKKLILTLGCALAAFAGRLGGRGLAVNADPIVTTLDLPALDPEKLRQREQALIAAGTEPLVAGKLAIDAETQQALRDHEMKLVEEQKAVALKKTVRTLKAVPEGESATEEVSLDTLTVAQLTTFAAEAGYDLAGASKKADIIAAITAAQAAEQKN